MPSYRELTTYLIFLPLFCLTSCIEYVDDLNNNPNAFTDAPLQLILNHAQLNIASVAESHPNRVASVYADQFVASDRSFNILFYGRNSTANNETWNYFFQEGVAQAQEAKEKALSENKAEVAAQASILEAYYFAEAALLFGDIPFDQVNDPLFNDPVFEDQIAVLEKSIELLNRGIIQSTNEKVQSDILESNSSWVQIGYALMARYLLALSEIDASRTAALNAQFSNKQNDLAIIHSKENHKENLFWQFQIEQRQDYIKAEDGFSFSFLARILDSTDTLYQGNSKSDESNRYNYYFDGSDINTNSGGFAAADANYPIISYEEIQLIIAETSVILNDSQMALDALNEVRQSNELRFNSTYQDFVITDFQPGGELYDGFSVETSLRMEIMLEKYRSVIGLPTYHDLLRTNNLINIPYRRHIRNSSYPEMIPQRFLYPESESVSNSNFPGYVDEYAPTRVNQ